jgi:hypothetical protein
VLVPLARGYGAEDLEVYRHISAITGESFEDKPAREALKQDFRRAARRLGLRRGRRADLEGLVLVEADTSPEDYQAMNELIRDAVGADLVDIGPDLVAMGRVGRRSHDTHRIERSPLGELIARQTGAVGAG